MDTVDPVTRSRIMRQIHSRNTSPELVVRKGLFARGFRYRLHDSTLPGKPDLVFPKYKAVVQVNGCFWHGHNCVRGNRLPKSNAEYWKSKIDRNVISDKRNSIALKKLGWRLLTIWECQLKEKGHTVSLTLDRAANWLTHGDLEAWI